MQTESTVVFNLAEIMQLEHERVAGEQAARAAAEQAARSAIEDAKREQLERERQDVERALRVQARLHLRATRRAERQAREREAALLRVRLDAEARVRLQRDALELERMKAQRGLRRSPRSQRGALFLGFSMLAALAVAMLLDARRGASELAAVRAAERSAQLRGAAAAQETERLRAQLAVLRAAQLVAPNPTTTRGVADPTAVTKPLAPGAGPRPHRSAGRHAGTAHRGAPSLGEHEGDGDDPIGGIEPMLGLDPLSDL